MEVHRPSRSDAHLSVEEEAKVEEETRDYFDGIAPKRHTKPPRSEYSTDQYVDAFPTNNASNGSIPEFVEFQRLEKDDLQKVVYNGRSGETTEEFVETEYYKDLNCIDKQHHTTGTGFIKVDDANDHGFSLEEDPTPEAHASCRGNPATNDWVPAAPDSADFVSDKPKRSEN